MKDDRLLQRLERKLRKYAVRNLMQYLLIGMGVIFLAQYVFQINLSYLLMFDRGAVMRGEVWRVISFIFLPPAGGIPFLPAQSGSIISLVFFMYLYWLIGSSLEAHWGTVKFNLFYLTGVLGSLIGGMITGYTTNEYLNLSLYLAMAILYPNMELRLFFFLPVKLKWLALIDALFLIYGLIVYPLPMKIAIIVAFANIILFFWRDVYNLYGRTKRKAEWRRKIQGR